MTAKTTDTNTNLKYKIVLEGFNKKQYESILSALNRLKKSGFFAPGLKIIGTSNSASNIYNTSNINLDTSIIDNNNRIIENKTINITIIF